MNMSLVYLIIFSVTAYIAFVLGAVFLILGAICALIFVVYEITWRTYEYFYYKSPKFLAIKESIRENTEKCNDLNQHIEELTNTYSAIKRTDHGVAHYIDNSKYNYQRSELEKLNYNDNVYECSLAVCKNAQAQPFKYLSKYFDISVNEETLSNFENVLNNFSAAEQGKPLLLKERERILTNLKSKIPLLVIKLRKKKLIKKLGFNDVNFSELYFPKFSFNYVSPGGNSSMQTDIILNVENIDKFVRYLSDLVKFKKSIAGQRALMTTALREKIKTRDNYTCKICNLSTNDEPNLLLEIDHIIPLSKNGVTSETNLQTLCWKCNRSKGSKIIENTVTGCEK